MSKRLLVAATTVGVAAVAVALSTAATTSPSPRGSTPQPKGAQTTPVKKSTKPAAAPSGVVSSPENSAETSRDAASYWTPERIRDAKPLEKTVTGGAGSPSSPSATTVRSSEPSKVVPARKQAKKMTSAKRANAAGQAGGVTTGPSTSDPGYWTQDRMDDAQPPDMSVTGNEDTGGSSDTGVIPASTP